MKNDLILYSMKSFTREEINTLIDGGKLIIVANHKVYDVTNMLNRHPGGKFVIRTSIGKNSDKHYSMHSERARKMWTLYQIGIEKTNTTLFCNII